MNETEPALASLDGQIGDLTLPVQGLVLRAAGETDAAGVTRLLPPKAGLPTAYCRLHSPVNRPGFSGDLLFLVTLRRVQCPAWRNIVVQLLLVVCIRLAQAICGD